MNLPPVKIYGERNTGTNYLAKLLEMNLAVRLLRGTYPLALNRPPLDGERSKDLYFALCFAPTLGWKHRAAPSPRAVRWAGRGGVGFVTLIKNPYSWQLSLYRRPYHYQGTLPGDFSTFLRTPWPTLGREGVRGPLPHPVALWNLKNRSYLELARSARVAIITYEALLADPLATVERIAGTLALPRRGEELVNLAQAAKARDADRNHDDYRDYYLQERWRDNLTAEDAAWINAHLDRELMGACGYTWIE